MSVLEFSNEFLNNLDNLCSDIKEIKELLTLDLSQIQKTMVLIASEIMKLNNKGS